MLTICPPVGGALNIEMNKIDKVSILKEFVVLSLVGDTEQTDIICQLMCHGRSQGIIKVIEHSIGVNFMKGAQWLASEKRLRGGEENKP